MQDNMLKTMSIQGKCALKLHFFICTDFGGIPDDKQQKHRKLEKLYNIN